MDAPHNKIATSKVAANPVFALVLIKLNALIGDCRGNGESVRCLERAVWSAAFAVAGVAMASAGFLFAAILPASLHCARSHDIAREEFRLNATPTTQMVPLLPIAARQR
jgi:hypothetical protein